jgi:hypothetical protein
VVAAAVVAAEAAADATKELAHEQRRLSLRERTPLRGAKGAKTALTEVLRRLVGPVQHGAAGEYLLSHNGGTGPQRQLATAVRRY